MTLYSADIMDLATPVDKKQKKPRKQKVLPTPEPSEPETVAPVAAVEPTAPKPKKEMTEKQKAALAKAQESRKRKKEEALAAKQKQEEEVKTKQLEEQQRQESLVAKKEAAKEKRRLAKEKRKADELAQEIDTEVKNLVKTPKPKKARVVRGDNPPAWFQKYIEGVKREQAHSTSEKKPVKQIQQEAQEEAKTKWDNGLVRDRLQNEVNGHMNRMYSMIFGSRNMR